MSANCRRVLILLWLGTLSCADKPALPEPGMDLYSVAPEDVTEVLFSSSARKLYAYRFTTGSPFQIWTAASNGTPAGQCTAGAGFDQWLHALATVKVERAVDKPFDAHDSNWADVLIRDTTTLEPVQVRLRVPASDDQPVIVDHRGHQYSVAVSPRVLRGVLSGCAQFR